MSGVTERATRNTFDEGVKVTMEQVQASNMSEEGLEEQFREPWLVKPRHHRFRCHVRREWRAFSSFRCSLAWLVEVRQVRVPAACHMCACDLPVFKANFSHPRKLLDVKHSRPARSQMQPHCERHTRPSVRYLQP